MFSNELYEWVSKLTNRKNCFKNIEPTMWSPKLIQRLRNTNNMISRAVGFWITSILRGFIIEFAIEMTISYNKVD